MRRPVAGKNRTPPWWNRDLERELSTLGRWKVRLRNAKSALRRRAIRAVFVRRKAEHKRNCFKARRDSWRSFVTETGNRNPWGPVYKWLKSGGLRPSERIPASIRTADGSFTSTLLDTGERLMEALVPSDTAENESAEQIAIREETGVSLGAFKPASPETAAEFDPPAACDVEEVEMAIWRMKPKKAPGLDGITAGILRQAWPVLSQQITHAFNACLRSNKFPNCWKRAAVVVIKKSPDKDPSEAKSYRPISLLPVLSKALEHIIVARIREDTASQMSGRQYGFTKNLSTVDAMHHALQWADSRREKYVMAVFLDISGAFDCLWWPQLVKDLESAKCRSSLIELTKSYLDGRQATMVIGDQTVTKSLNKGCPQGKIQSPGPDGIPSWVWGEMHVVSTGRLVDMLNLYLIEGFFLGQWKRTRLTLLAKPRNPEGKTCSNRPLCLLDNIDEFLLTVRMNSHMSTTGIVLSEWQFVFWSGRCMDDVLRWRAKSGTGTAARRQLASPSPG
ncbi:hypothetical protein ACI65C_004204 [Semiaphis heraclei]